MQPDTWHTIDENGFIGIDLGQDLVTPNDDNDTDSGANNLQNFPVITEVQLDIPTSGKTTVRGTLDTRPNRNFRLEFFVNGQCDACGFGEGHFFEFAPNQFLEVNSGTSGNVSFAHALDLPLDLTDFVTLTATDMESDGAGTSEFSRCANSSGLLVNSSSDLSDENPSDGICNTGFFIVRGTKQEVECSLRAAIESANVIGGQDAITFDIPVVSGVPTIQPLTALPFIFDRLVIDGASQPGGLVEIDGSAAGGTANGLNLGAGFSIVSGLVINNFSGNGILITGGGTNTIQANRIGTDAAGTDKKPNGNGILILNSERNFIDRNLISANTGD